MIPVKLRGSTSRLVRWKGIRMLNAENIKGIASRVDPRLGGLTGDGQIISLGEILGLKSA